MISKRFYGAALMGAIVVPMALQGCGADNPLCCTEFKVGATIDANIGGGAESKVAVQAVADFAGIASASIDDITTACRSIAQDLDTPTADTDAAEANPDRQAKMKAYCSLAVKAIVTVKASVGAKLQLVATAPKCSASVSAKANCQAKCSGSAKCEATAELTCTGGKLEVSCKGDCTAKAGASLSCEGECTGSCEGSCTASAGGVDCTGKCEGTCDAKAGVGTGTGAQADGTCNGTCKGTCAVTAPSAKCEGSCNGKCTASCKGSATASVKCDGECKGDVEPLKCDGKLEGGCKVEAKCEGNCDASVKAKAECTPPSITVSFTGAANIQAAGKLQATLEANLGVVLAFQARLEGMVEVGAQFTGNINAVADIKVACIPLVVASAGNAVADATASLQATVDIAGAVTAS